MMNLPDIPQPFAHWFVVEEIAVFNKEIAVISAIYSAYIFAPLYVAVVHPRHISPEWNTGEAFHTGNNSDINSSKF
ncbi:MAG: hypothetical protein KF746_21335 [Chitinophagaceae bacterium]|nr:hypothetical protein [Chitinophagaceae bacterium]